MLLLALFGGRRDRLLPDRFSAIPFPILHPEGFVTRALSPSRRRHPVPARLQSELFDTFQPSDEVLPDRRATIARVPTQPPLWPRRINRENQDGSFHNQGANTAYPRIIQLVRAILSKLHAKRYSGPWSGKAGTFAKMLADL